MATWVAGEIAESQERDNLDTRLTVNLAAGREEFADALDDARMKAERIAASEEVQRALAEKDQAAARRIAAAEGNTGLVADGTLLGGEDPWPASRTVDVVDDQDEVVGNVVVGVPLDEGLAERLAGATGLRESDALAITDEGRTLADSGSLEPGATIPAEHRG